MSFWNYVNLGYQGYYYSMDAGSTINKTWNECDQVDLSYYATCDDKKFAVVASLANQNTIPSINTFLVDINPMLVAPSGYLLKSKFWVSKKRHGGFTLIQRRVNRDNGYECIFPDSEEFDIRFYVIEFAEIDERINDVYFCMDSFYCPDFVKFDMCKIEERGCHPEAQGLCPSGAEVVFQFYSAWK